ncbi:hypothetical protein EA472_11395 [Natrarchaeobius oligotrophus]|uniref:Uncharacterized protein n=1 Tax=Natrarchaeobius chitinivorans TaxID=1679083 RepID=A0A3N6MCN0_NATCH|nr:hypothetical protein EA472_11395 [Natrarchaeobius chitinivorans]
METCVAVTLDAATSARSRVTNRRRSTEPVCVATTAMATNYSRRRVTEFGSRSVAVAPLESLRPLGLGVSDDYSRGDRSASGVKKTESK